LLFTVGMHAIHPDDSAKSPDDSGELEIEVQLEDIEDEEVEQPDEDDEDVEDIEFDDLSAMEGPDA
jgi:hypothetical protein